MRKTLYTLEEAAAKKNVSRQAMHAFAKRHITRCEVLGNKGKRAGMILIPESLLREYEPIDYRQRAGYERAKKATK